MDLSELYNGVVSGKVVAFAISSDTEDAARSILLGRLAMAGYPARHCDSLAVCAAEASSESLGFESDKRLVLVAWPSDEGGFTTACSLIRSLANGDTKVGFLCDPFPPKRSKQSSGLLSLVEVVSMDKDAGSVPWVQGMIDDMGMKASVGAVRMLASRLGGSPEALPRMLRALNVATDGSFLEKDVLDLSPFIPEDDGRKILDDLLHLRSISLCRRLDWLHGAQPVSLFRAAASEVISAHVVASYLESLEKGKLLDLHKVADQTGLREEAIRTRYLPLAKELGRQRLESLLERLEMADAVLLRTPYGSAEAATALALGACSI